MKTLADDLLEAREPDSILAALARYEWGGEHEGDCPADKVPTLAAVIEAERLEFGEEAVNRIEATHNPNLAEPFCWNVTFGVAHLGGILPVLHLEWCALPAPRPAHPADSVIRSWWERAPAIEPDTRPTAIAPGDLFAWAGTA
ncbi:MAG: hypothetical protein OXH14_05015, partial [Alphaproteobacteria bacterium]|nr:hypothetical protein [Alphaproteobacteria bacterium]